MLILQIVIRDGIAIDLSNLDINPTGGTKSVFAQYVLYS